MVGVSPFADQVREVLRAGAVSSWHLHELPDELTPLHAVRSQLGPRYYNLLERNGFARTWDEFVRTPPAPPDTAHPLMLYS